MRSKERDSLRRSAVENGHVDALELLITAKALVFPSLKGWTALHDASKADAAVLLGRMHPKVTSTLKPSIGMHALCHWTG